MASGIQWFDESYASRRHFVDLIVVFDELTRAFVGHHP